MNGSPIKTVMVSNYINHHQIPFCKAMIEELCGSFAFIQMEEIEEERLLLGWKEENDLDYVVKFHGEEERAKELILNAQMVIWGGCEDESLLKQRLDADKPVIRYCERFYKEALWKWISPKGLIRKYSDYTKYNKKNTALLCAGAYVPLDFSLIKAYPNRMLKWGYFPETVTYDADKLMDLKSKEGEPVRILWAARFIGWKHPEFAIAVASCLKKEGTDFVLDMIGDGKKLEKMKEYASKLGVSDKVNFRGSMPPEEVRKFMEKADIFMMTSDRNEGWGAVLNEAMNSGCAVVCDYMAGASRYLIKPGVNGLMYKTMVPESLLTRVSMLANDAKLRKTLGINAYKTIVNEWNAKNAASHLCKVIESMLSNNEICEFGEDYDGPCAKAEVLKEKYKDEFGRFNNVI